MKDITRILSRYACASRFEDLPPAVQHEGLRAFVNFIGCAAGGSREEEVDLMLLFLAEFNGAAEATIVGRHERLDVLNAAFINSMSSSALAFNDTHYATVAHPTSPVAAALLALAARGFECSDSMIEGAKGFAVSYAQMPNLDAAVENLGRVFEISTLAYKPYPSGVVIHPIIDACLEIVKSNAFDAAQIERIELTLNPLAAKLTHLPNPRDRGQALVSLQHWTAATLVYKAAGIAQVTHAVVRDPAIEALRRKVTFTNDENVGREAAHVRVVLNDGNTMEAAVQHCRGSIERPLNDQDITDKTLGQLRTVYSHDTAEKILEQCWDIERCLRVDAFCKAFVQG